MKTYVLMISKYFPKSHKRAGGPTAFISKIAMGTKKHTIRGNYDLWVKRFEKINRGEAVLSVRYWEDLPYRSKQIEAFVFDISDGIGIQRIVFRDLYNCMVDGKSSPVWLDYNDGLNAADFQDWFKDYDLSKPMAVIHFTAFRY